MKILEIKNLAILGIKIIRFARFKDSRGYFAETFRKSDVASNPELSFLTSFDFPQTNESFAREGVIKGLHFQWEPPLGKLLRTIYGHMVDMILDIRKNSPTFGKIILYDMLDNREKDYGEWIWLPPGFAHGSFFVQDSAIEYFFSADYNPRAEAGITPLAPDFDWSLCDPALKSRFEQLANVENLMSDKDRSGLSLAGWVKDSRSDNFIFQND